MEVSCKEYPLRLVQVVTATVTMAAIRHLARGAVLAVMAIPETAATQPHQAVMAVMAIMDPHLLRMVAAAATDLCTPPAVVEPDLSSTSGSVPWHPSLLEFKQNPRLITNHDLMCTRNIQHYTECLMNVRLSVAPLGLPCIAMPG